jgi:hypothetical protein
MSTATYMVCNCHAAGPAQLFSAVSRTFKHTVLPPQSASMFTTSPSTPADEDAGAPRSNAPFALPDTCAVVHIDSMAGIYDSSGGMHVYRDDLHSRPVATAVTLAPFVPSSPAGGSSVQFGSTGMPPSAGAGFYTAFIPGSATLTLRLPPSIADEKPVVLSFMNGHSAHALEVYWVDYDGQLVVRRVLRWACCR